MVKVNWLNEWFPSYFPPPSSIPPLPGQPSAQVAAGLGWSGNIAFKLTGVWNSYGTRWSKLNRVALKRENFKVSEF